MFKNQRLNIIIRVDRSVPPHFPYLTIKGPMYPELEKVGPVKYNLAKVKLYLHNDQKNRKWMKGTCIYEHFKKTNILKTCLGFHDAQEIQLKGIDVFEKLFGNKRLFCWKSIVRLRKNVFVVPWVGSFYDDEVGPIVRFGWVRLDDFWSDFHPAACFPN